LFVDGLHAPGGQRPGVLDDLFADAPELWIDCGIVLVGCLALEDATRAELLPELGILRIVRILRLLFGVQVIEVAEDLVEAVNSRQVFIAIAEMVLAKLACRITEVLKELGDRRIFRAQADRRAGKADFGQAGTNRRLPGDECGPAGRAALLAVEV